MIGTATTIPGNNCARCSITRQMPSVKVYRMRIVRMVFCPASPVVVEDIQTNSRQILSKEYPCLYRNTKGNFRTTESVRLTCYSRLDLAMGARHTIIFCKIKGIGIRDLSVSPPSRSLILFLWYIEYVADKGETTFISSSDMYARSEPLKVNSTFPWPCLEVKQSGYDGVRKVP